MKLLSRLRWSRPVRPRALGPLARILHERLHPFAEERRAFLRRWACVGARFAIGESPRAIDSAAHPALEECRRVLTSEVLVVQVAGRGCPTGADSRTRLPTSDARLDLGCSRAVGCCLCARLPTPDVRETIFWSKA